ncbi:hypothetical protein K488DRAFT_44984, partial [Vararia minispora EC-137]
SPVYLDRDWLRHVHPEGKPYSSRGIAPTLVTEVRVEDATLAHHLDAWAGLVSELAREHEHLLHAGVELFLEPDLSDNSCSYYFVDHEMRTVFWLDAYETNQLGLPPSFSGQHLKLSIQQNYWIHVEMFCVHLKSLHSDALEELISIFVHGQIDHMTSFTSTFPYSKTDCADIIKILKTCRSMPYSPNTFACIARLWSHVISNRYLTHYGEEHCRLDRTTSIYGGRTTTRNRVLDAVSRALFCLPDAIRSKLEDQFVDDLVTKHQWSAFIRTQMQDWKLSMQWTFALLMYVPCWSVHFECHLKQSCSGNALTLPTAYSTFLAHTTMLICATSALVGAVLHVRHQDLVDADAPDAVCIPLFSYFLS